MNIEFGSLKSMFLQAVLY